MSRDKPQPGPKRPEYEPTSDEQRLAYFIEECGEVLAAAGKTLRWGPHSYNPELPLAEREENGTWLRRELADLSAAIERLPSASVLRLHKVDPSTIKDPITHLVHCCGAAVRGAAREMDRAQALKIDTQMLGQAIEFVHGWLDLMGIP